MREPESVTAERMRGSRSLWVGVLLSACSGGGSSQSKPADPYPSCKNGRYVLDDPATTAGGFDSAACVEFMKAIPAIKTDATKAPEFITPLAGALLPSTPFAKFTWSKGTLSMLLRRPSFWNELRHELAFENVAHAAPDGGSPDAGSTLTSDAYVIIFRAAGASSDGGVAELLRVMTINLTFTPTDAQWATLQAAGTIEASIYGMHFDTGKIVGGVFTPPQARAFTIAQ